MLLRKYLILANQSKKTDLNTKTLSITGLATAAALDTKVTDIGNGI